mmetsp:Transcript_15985/g.21413  ORF Transcript_15985/g.21413 Transcript_15985/m.21413 type:complete len:152 (-) Transcript_15985:281-736(-)
MNHPQPTNNRTVPSLRCLYRTQLVHLSLRHCVGTYVRKQQHPHTTSIAYVTSFFKYYKPNSHRIGHRIVPFLHRFHRVLAPDERNNPDSPSFKTFASHLRNGARSKAKGLSPKLTKRGQFVSTPTVGYKPLRRIESSSLEKANPTNLPFQE